jgi:hypothetical protein
LLFDENRYLHTSWGNSVVLVFGDPVEFNAFVDAYALNKSSLKLLRLLLVARGRITRVRFSIQSITKNE